MIRPSKDGKMLWMLPPEKSGEKELEFPLVYANTCPKCNNLVQALFLTDKRINPKPWEEIFTKTLDANGHYKRIIPGRHERFRSRYSVTTLGRGSTVSAELIRFAEHFDHKESMESTICSYMAISSVIPEYRVYDMMLAILIDPSKYSLKDENYDTVKGNILKAYMGSDQYVFSPAIGEGPECVFISRTAHQWFLEQATSSYLKPYQIPVQSKY